MSEFKVGDVVWVRGEVVGTAADEVGVYFPRFGVGTFGFEHIRPDAPAPAEMDDVDTATYFLLTRMRAGEKWRPQAWANSTTLRDGHCRIERQHTYVECTPSTVGASVSPAIAGVREAVRRYGLDWEPVTDTPTPAETDDVAALRRAAELHHTHWQDADRLNWGATCNTILAERLHYEQEAARRVPTPLEALKGLLSRCEGGGVFSDAVLADARRAIAAAEANGEK